jgi:glutamate N-acetyltransferase/amino-acid N-acetyltransferase
LKFIDGGVCAPKGFLANGIHCGLRKDKSRKDLAFILSEVPCFAAGVYTENKVKGAPIIVTKEHLQNGIARAVVVNSSNANTCNADGVSKARRMCKAAADFAGIDKQDVIVASTGVIGEPLNITPIEKGMPELIKGLSRDGSARAAQAIMTTDTFYKEFAAETEIGGTTVKMGLICKGSGMINPNMATMLAFITTDAKITSKLLQKALTDVTAKTFNCLSIDGDTSTNDTLCILANGMADNAAIDNIFSHEYEEFCNMLLQLCRKGVASLAKDGEGATKLVMCHVKNCGCECCARKMAKSVIMSPLVKTAMFAADANWGRILCALGYADTPLDTEKVEVKLTSPAGEVLVCKNGAGVNFSEEEAKKVLLHDEITIEVDLHDGEYEATAWGCDLTYDYVKINGDYRT